MQIAIHKGNPISEHEESIRQEAKCGNCEHYRACYLRDHAFEEDPACIGYEPADLLTELTEDD